MIHRPPMISVIGTSTPTDELYDISRRLGRLLAEKGFVIICGGRGGVMEGVCRGAFEAGGLSIGLLPHDLSEANPWVTYPLVTGIGEGRNLAIAFSGEMVIAVGGAFGTLTEIGYALRAGKKIIGLHTWTIHDETGQQVPIETVSSPEEAVERLIIMLNLTAHLMEERHHEVAP